MNNEAVASGAASVTGDSAIHAIILFGLIFGAYLAPTIVAVARKHRQTGSIAALNILLGWTFLGWIVAIVWSLANQKPPQTIIVHSPPTDRA